MLCCSKTPRAWLDLQILEWAVVGDDTAEVGLLEFIHCLQLRLLYSDGGRVGGGGLLRVGMAGIEPLSCRGWWWTWRDATLQRTCRRCAGGLTRCAPWGRNRLRRGPLGSFFQSSSFWRWEGAGQRDIHLVCVWGTLHIRCPRRHGWGRRWKAGWRARSQDQGAPLLHSIGAFKRFWSLALGEYHTSL